MITVIAGIGLNIFAYTGNKPGGADLRQDPVPTAPQANNGGIANPADIGTNTADNQSGGEKNHPVDMSGKTWYLYYELSTDKDAKEPIYWYYYSVEFFHLADGVHYVELTPLDGDDFPDNPYYPGGGHMPAFSIEASAILHQNGELSFMFNGDSESLVIFDDWQWDERGGGWVGAAWQVGDEIMGKYSKLAMITDMS